VWIDVRADDLLHRPSVLFVVDPTVPAFRISENTGDDLDGWCTFVCEMSAMVTDEQAGSAACDVLHQLGVIGPGVVPEVIEVLAGPSFALPSFANRERHAEALSALGRAGLPADVIGVDAFGADSFNEQVVQGMAAARRWS